MSTKQFHYYDKNWESEILECPRCHWTGTFHQGATCAYPDFTDCQCPNCDITTPPCWPWSCIPPSRRCWIRAVPMMSPRPSGWIAKKKAFWAVALTKPEQLPDIPGSDDLYLTWDFIWSEDHMHQIEIRHGDQVLFSEPASWEALGEHCRGGRYEAICKILKEKYGQRVRDLAPTERSWMWLYGDRIAGPIVRTWSRDELFRPRSE